MDIDAVAKRIRQAVMDSAEDQGRTFNASILDDVIAKELRLHMPAAPSNYPWAVVPMIGNLEVAGVAMNPQGQIVNVNCGPGGMNTLYMIRTVDDEYR